MAANALKRIILQISILVWVSCSSSLFGQLRDSFEGGKPRWQLGRNDVNAVLSVQQLTTHMPHSGQACELLELRCSQGTSLQLFYPIPPCAIIDELRASLWVHNVASGTQIAFRVVYPNTAHPVTGNQLTALLSGTSSKQGGQWSQIEVREPAQALTQRNVLLRSEFGSEIDLRNAYIDAVVVNPYTGPGVIRMKIDDLSIDSNVDVSLADPSNDRFSGALDAKSIQAVSMSDRMHDLQQGVPRWLQYRGESLAWIKTLGVTGVVLDSPKDVKWLREAQQVGLKVMTPPPASTPPVEEWGSYEAVQGWLLGSALDLSHVEPARALRQRLVQFPAPLLRPTLAESMEQHWVYSRVADVLAIPAPLPSSVRDGGEMVQLLRASYEQTRGRTLPLTSLTIQATPEYDEQTKALTQAIGTRLQSLPSLDVLQARLRLYRCIAAGARGWYLRSQTPLDSGEESDLMRAELLKGLNAEAEWLSPWIQAANNPYPLDPRSTPGYQGSVLATNNSQLIILIATDEFDSTVAPAPNGTPLEIALPNYQTSSQAVRISHGRLEPVLNKVSPKEAVARIERPGLIELIVVTSDQRVLGYLQQRSLRATDAMLNLHSANANQLQKLSQQTLVAEGAREGTPAWNMVHDAEGLSRRMYNLMNRNQAGAIEAAEQASALYQRVIRDSWLRANEQFPKPQSSPWLENITGLPIHWELSRIVANRPWMTSEIPANGWGDWESMQRLGWSIDKRIEDQVQSDAKIEANRGADGGPAIHLTARSLQGNPIQGGFGGSSLRIFTPAIDVPSGSLVRIDGMVQVRSIGSTPQSGLLVYDSVGGPASGSLYTMTRSGNTATNSAEALAWQPFTLFRFLSDGEGIRILMEMRGEGDYVVSNLRVASLMPSLASKFNLSPIPPP